jgi:glycosyltransferase involved in cell wall biosynthesis
MQEILGAAKWHVRHIASQCLSKIEGYSNALENALPRNRNRLIILDEVFPSLTTGFRVAEFNSILRYFPDSTVYSTLSSRGEFRAYAQMHPALSNRVRRFSRNLAVRGAAAYVVFLNNTYNFIEPLEAAGLPFAFELYPGGGFRLDDNETDAKLSRVFRSPMFRNVIVTQSVTRDYLLKRSFCRAEQIEFIFGVVVASDVLGQIPSDRRRYGFGKTTLDICFVAHKYVQGGIDKGYDRFISCARILSNRHSDVEFHVVGPFDQSDADVGDLAGRIRFHGVRPTSFFPSFYAGMDIILSPNTHSVLAPGAFDGFPTG